MPGLKELLAAYAEGKRREAFGANYDQERMLNEANIALANENVANAPLRRQSMEQGLERGGLTIEELKRQAEDAKRRREILSAMGLEGFDVAGDAMQYNENQPLREAQRRSAATGADIAERRLATMPTAEEAMADRAAQRKRAEAYAAYMMGTGRQGGSRYTGKGVTPEIYYAAQMEAIKALPHSGVLPEGVYVDGKGRLKQKVEWGFDKPYTAPPEVLNMLHQLTVQRLMEAGISPEALVKGGYTVPQEGASGLGSQPFSSHQSDCDPDGLGVGCE